MEETKEICLEVQKEDDPYIMTYTEKQFFINNPSPEMIEINDIAHALAFKCRYNGHCPIYMSVAEHSVILSYLVPKYAEKWALLHDASEAYIPDVPRPFKKILTNLNSYEDSILKVIAEKFGLGWPMPEVVHHLDTKYVGEEARQLWGKNLDWTVNYPAMNFRLKFLSPQEAEIAFIERYKEITIEGYQSNYLKNLKPKNEFKELAKALVITLGLGLPIVYLVSYLLGN